jgi:hypothetical protein
MKAESEVYTFALYRPFSEIKEIVSAIKRVAWK